MPGYKNGIISAVSNLSTAYNLVVINLVKVLVRNQYCEESCEEVHGKKVCTRCTEEVELAATACLVGAIAGQLIFGYVGDCMGRSRALQLTMALSIFGSLFSAFAVPLDSNHPETIFTFLALTRFVLGVGVGGVYPLSATIASESSGSASRGRAASLVFSMQGIANLLVPLVVFITIAIFDVPMDLSKWNNNGYAWRFALAFGAVPGIILAPFKVSETRKVNPSEMAGAEEPMATGTESSSMGLCEALKQPGYRFKLLGTAGSWFLFDITFYGNSLFQPTVLQHVFDTGGGGDSGSGEDGSGNLSAMLYGTSKDTQFGDSLQTNLCGQMALIAAIGLPGYYVSVYFMDILGRRNIQLQGFFFMGLVFGILGLFVKQLETIPALMLILYGLTFFFSNFGPNSTTFILPAETFPPHMRSTLNGFSAAMGKVGASVGSATFKSVFKLIGLGPTMIVCGVISWLGLLLTWFCIEDRRGKGMEGEVDSSSEPTEPTKVVHST